MGEGTPQDLDDVLDLLDQVDEHLRTLSPGLISGPSPQAQENRAIRGAEATLARARAREVRAVLQDIRERAAGSGEGVHRVAESEVALPRGDEAEARGVDELGVPSEPVDCGGLSDPDRLAALAYSGLDARPDTGMEWFAERVRHRLAVPTALVSLVRTDEQVFPGAVGLPPAFMETRRTPLTHSFCQHVVATGRPLVVEDAREDAALSRNLAIPDLGVVAYAGMPLTDGSGRVLGSLCAIDGVARTWGAAELDTLADLATACSGELRLRMAHADAERERAQRDRLQAVLEDSYERSQALLDISRSVGDSTSLADVRAGLDELAGGVLGADHVSLLVLDGDRLRPVRPPEREPDPDVEPAAELHERSPSTLAVRERRTVTCSSREQFHTEFDDAARRRFARSGLHAVVAAPLLGGGGAVGALVLGWRRPREFSAADLLLANTAATYTARAIDHADWVQHRVTVAREMQQAMLTDLPDLPDLRMAARYQPADAREYVGGDWYDVHPLHDPRRPRDRAFTVSIGDIVGHELDAAGDMAQVRSMLRQATWDHPGGPPSRVAQAFETANHGVGLGAVGTAVIAHLHRRDDTSWTITWVNMGHPAPLLVRPDGTAEHLGEHGRWFGLPAGLIEKREDVELVVPPGSLLVLYTDGLVERRGADIDDRTEALRRMVADLADVDPHLVVDSVMAELGHGAGDDVVTMAIRLT
jgi:GAF domain-containing protein